MGEHAYIIVWSKDRLQSVKTGQNKLVFFRSFDLQNTTTATSGPVAFGCIWSGFGRFLVLATGPLNNTEY